MIDSLRAAVLEGGRSRYERVFYSALDIASPDLDFWMKGLHAFRDARKINDGKKTLDQITVDALEVASNGNKKRLKNAVFYFNNTMSIIRRRQNKMNRIVKWLWLAGAILFAALVIYMAIVHPKTIFFFF